MKNLEKKKRKLEKLKEHHKSIAKTYGSELCARSMIDKEEKLEKEIKELEDNIVVWSMYAEGFGIKSGKAYKHLFENHTHPLGDDGEDMVTFDVALEAIKKAEKELMKIYENRKNVRF